MIKDQNEKEIKNYFLAGSENNIGNCLDDFAVLQILKENQFGFIAKVRSLKNGNTYVMNKYDLKKAEEQRLLDSYKNQLDPRIYQLAKENVDKTTAEKTPELVAASTPDAASADGTTKRKVVRRKREEDEG